MAPKRKTTRSARAAKPNVTISFLSEKGRKPVISAAKAERLMAELRAVSGGVMQAAACSTSTCSAKRNGMKGALEYIFGGAFSCRSDCKWFWSKGGGWQYECYIRCNNGKGLEVEG